MFIIKLFILLFIFHFHYSSLVGCFFSSWPLVGLLVSVHFAGETEFRLFSKSFEPFSKGSAGETGLKLFPKSFEPFLKGLGPFSKGSCFALVPFSKGFLWCSPFPKALVLLWWLWCPFPKAFCGAALFQRHGMAQVFS